MRRSDIAAFVILSCAGFLAGHLAMECRRPDPRPGEVGIHVEPFRMTRSAGEPFLVTESSWLELPMLREDFDLMADVELSEGAELDFVLRRVEPRPLQGVSLPAHGRFVALRLSTKQDGEPWRLPTAALLGEPGGARIGAGGAGEHWGDVLWRVPGDPVAGAGRGVCQCGRAGRGGGAAGGAGLARSGADAAAAGAGLHGAA